MITLPLVINGELVYFELGKDKLPPMGVAPYDYIRPMFDDTV